MVDVQLKLSGRGDWVAHLRFRVRQGLMEWKQCISISAETLCLSLSKAELSLTLYFNETDYFYDWEIRIY